MLQTLDDVVTSLAGLVVLLVLLLMAIRAAALRRARRARRFRLAAEASLGTYLAGSGAAPEMAGRGQRAILLAVARDALADLRGDERDRLVALLVQLGFAREAMLALSARRTVARRRAAETLATLATPLAVPAVTEALADRDVLVRTTCACTLAGTGGEAAVPAIMAVARRDAPAAPGAPGDPSSLGLLERLLGAPDWSLRAAAAGALAQLGEPGCAALTRAAVAGPPEAAALAAAALDP